MEKLSFLANYLWLNSLATTNPEAILSIHFKAAIVTNFISQEDEHIITESEMMMMYRVIETTSDDNKRISIGTYPSEAKAHRAVSEFVLNHVHAAKILRKRYSLRLGLDQATVTIDDCSYFYKVEGG